MQVSTLLFSAYSLVPSFTFYYLCRMKKTLAIGMKSPFTGGRVFLAEGIEEIEFRGEEYPVHASYYVCEDTGEEFNTTEQVDMTYRELCALYRAKHAPDGVADS